MRTMHTAVTVPPTISAAPERWSVNGSTLANTVPNTLTLHGNGLRSRKYASVSHISSCSIVTHVNTVPFTTRRRVRTHQPALELAAVPRVCVGLCLQLRQFGGQLLPDAALLPELSHHLAGFGKLFIGEQRPDLGGVSCQNGSAKRPPPQRHLATQPRTVSRYSSSV